MAQGPSGVWRRQPSSTRRRVGLRLRARGSVRPVNAGAGRAPAQAIPPRGRGARGTHEDRSLRVEATARSARRRNFPGVPAVEIDRPMSVTVKHRLPEVIGAGPGRTGTTWLHRVLEGRVDLPYGVKETQFFSTYYDKGIDWYARHFRYATGERTIAEICPYLFHPLAPDRIKTHIPNCRVITTLRSPIEHSFSAYKLVTHYAWASGSFAEGLKFPPNLAAGHRYAFPLRKMFYDVRTQHVPVTI